ncbi:hypothetical protein [Curtobacterium sp. VKM Ac-2884]|uniref:hypothetical protein n=1 Tax=Curtobacterium sp. VKM Ac-2884 TaxID=2783818 RepID=UPI00188CAF88|nr:hypothetical protein [Curtobacterium sp. VKM Ac-2884]MBF4602818.1 hypothetical protein [Curtobacterium sp. VKM Ac-2884]
MSDQLFVQVPLQPYTALLRQLTTALTENTRLVTPAGPSREQVEAAVGEVLFHVTNFPEPAQSRLLGQDMAPLRRKITDAVLAALSQSAPTAESSVSICACGHARGEHWGAGGQCTMVDCSCRGHVHKEFFGEVAAPPRIADMVPGTTFTAAYGRDLSASTRWMRCTGPSRCVNVGGVRFDADAIDPSTIRDVTPPPAASEADADGG